MKKILRIDYLFAIYGLAFLSSGLYFFHSIFFGALDINVHDKYFVTTYSDFTILLSAAFLLFFLVYFLFNIFKRPLQVALGVSHFIITSISLTLILIIATLFPFSGQPRRYYAGDDSIFEFHFFDINNFILTAFALLLIGQVIFLINIMWTILGRKTSTHNP